MAVSWRSSAAELHLKPFVFRLARSTVESLTPISPPQSPDPISRDFS
jgi:hypothetical protein